jgi:hypothetical protein
VKQVEEKWEKGKTDSALLNAYYISPLQFHCLKIIAQKSEEEGDKFHFKYVQYNHKKL